jgi:CsoR family transcriptional regulator, copper-sensing transcriptional repressor
MPKQNKNSSYGHVPAKSSDEPLKNPQEHSQKSSSPAEFHAHEPNQKPHPHEHDHVHSADSVKAVTNRLSRIEGHVRAIKTMVQEDRDCPQVLIQIAAVRGALDRVARMILDEHLTACVARAAHAGNIEQEIAELKAALDRFLP